MAGLSGDELPDTEMLRHPDPSPSMQQKNIRALATDFDGTIASHGIVPEATIEALHKAREAGMLLILVTGRELRDFELMKTDLSMFDIAVVENGAVLYDPQRDRVTPLAPPASEDFIRELQRRGVSPLSVGSSIVATCEPHEMTVLQAIKDLGLELIVTFNKGAVMVLPPNVNKASGLVAALGLFGMHSAEVAGIGDAENDHAFIDICGLSAAVGNAIPMLKEHADIVTLAEEGAGVIEFIEVLLAGAAHVEVEVAQ
jgi:hydroxymethylpyrimidine pyrophosphatase-like HAD family hydrolase